MTPPPRPFLLLDAVHCEPNSLLLQGHGHGQVSSTSQLPKGAFTLPTKNLSLFLHLPTLLAASYALLLVCNVLAVRPLVASVDDDYKALSVTDTASAEYSKLLETAQKDSMQLVLIGAIYLLAALIITSVLRIITFYVTVATHSGDLVTLHEVLVKARRNIKGPAVTLGLVYLQELGSTCIIMALVHLFTSISKDWITLLLFTFNLYVCPLLFLVYFSFLGALTTAISVAEADSDWHSEVALERAWTLANGKHMTWLAIGGLALLLSVAIHPLYVGVVMCASKCMACALVLGFVYVFLLAFLELFVHAAVTVCYYSLRQRQVMVDQLVYAKLPCSSATHV